MPAPSTLRAWKSVRAELTATMLKANTDMATAGQDMVESAMDYGRAFMDWSFAVSRGAAPTAPF